MSTMPSRDVGSISNLGARYFEGTFFLKKKGARSKHAKGTSLFIEKSWGGTCHQCAPVPTSLAQIKEIIQRSIQLQFSVTSLISCNVTITINCLGNWQIDENSSSGIWRAIPHLNWIQCNAVCNDPSNRTSLTCSKVCNVKTAIKLIRKLNRWARSSLGLSGSTETQQSIR